jgi:DNA-directed RNA polymerases I, II, and III subunit RPABC1
MAYTKISSDKIENLWRSRKTMVEGVIPDRGYKVPNEDRLSYDEFVDWVGEDDEAIVREAMTLIYENDSAKNPNKIMVAWPSDPKLGTNMRNIYTKMNENECTRAIVIVDHSVTHWAKSIIRGLKQKKIYVDTYILTETLFNVMEHRLVPKHVICSKSEKKRVLSAYAVKGDALPHIRSTDPVVRHLGAIRGQLLKITRESDTQIGLETINYRQVI